MAGLVLLAGYVFWWDSEEAGPTPRRAPSSDRKVDTSLEAKSSEIDRRLSEEAGGDGEIEPPTRPRPVDEDDEAQERWWRSFPRTIQNSHVFGAIYGASFSDSPGRHPLENLPRNPLLNPDDKRMSREVVTALMDRMREHRSTLRDLQAKVEKAIGDECDMLDQAGLNRMVRDADLKGESLSDYASKTLGSRLMSYRKVEGGYRILVETDLVTSKPHLQARLAAMDACARDLVDTFVSEGAISREEAEKLMIFAKKEAGFL